jgi:hypothetical protein
MHNESTIQSFFDKLVTEGWEIIHYKEESKSSGSMSLHPQEISIHVIALCAKRQEDTLPTVL